MFDKILSLLGGNLFTGVAEIVGKFVTDPTKAAELHAELAKLEAATKVQLEGLAVQDRNSARQREMSVKDRTPSILAYATLSMFLCYIAGVTFFPLLRMQGVMLDKEFVSLALGWLGGTASTVIAYYFGSSAGQDHASRKL